MRVMISTPTYGGNLKTICAGSLMSAIERAKNEGILTEVQLVTQRTESLIHRGRDRDALRFTELQYDKLLTIDSDIEFSYEDFRRIITSPHPIVGGVYPLKNFPIVMNFNPLQEHAAEFFKSHRGMDHTAWHAYVNKYADKDGYAEVRHLPTGFLCVHADVFVALSKVVDVYWTFQPDTGELKGFYHFYSSGIHERTLESEDWSFCRRARELGFKIMLDTRVTLGHVGDWTFRLGQFFGEAQQGGEEKQP